MFNLLIISSVYEGYLNQFHADKDNELSYTELYESLISVSSEFVASYTRNFRRKGINVHAVIANDKVLQVKWQKEFGAGSNTDLLFQQIQYYHPDVIWIEDVRFTDDLFLSGIKEQFSFVRLLVAYHCAPVKPGTLSRFRHFDFLITCTPGLKDQFEKEGIRSFLIYHAFDADILERISAGHQMQHDIVFTGSLRQGKGYHYERIKLLEYLLNNGLDISLYLNLERGRTRNLKRILRAIYVVLRFLGVSNPEKVSRYLEYGKDPVISYPGSILGRNSNPVYGTEMLFLLASSKIVLNNHGEVAGNYAGNMRMFEATAAGSCLVTDNKANIQDLFEPGKEVIVYDSMEDCLKKIQWLLKNDPERKRIADAGRSKTLNAHTVSSRCDSIIELLLSEMK